MSLAATTASWAGLACDVPKALSNSCSELEKPCFRFLGILTLRDGLGTHHRSLRTFCTGKNTKRNSSNGWIVDMWHVVSESRCQWRSKPLKCRRIIICINPKPSVFVVSEPYLGLIQTFQPMLIIFASHRLNILDQFWHLMTCMAFGMALWPCAFGGMDEHLKKLCKFRRDRSGCNRCCC